MRSGATKREFARQHSCRYSSLHPVVGDQIPTCSGLVSTSRSSFPDSEGMLRRSVRLDPGLHVFTLMRVAVSTSDTSIAHTVLPPGEARSKRDSLGFPAFFRMKLW